MTGKSGDSFPPGKCDYLNIGMGGSLLARILILLQTSFVHFAYITGGTQLTKVAYGLFLCAL